MFLFNGTTLTSSSRKETPRAETAQPASHHRIPQSVGRSIPFRQLHAAVMTDALMFAPGWHRKWLLLLAMLATLYLCRYRLVGALVSKVVTFCLTRKEPSLKIDVQVKLVLLWQLQLVHVEIKGGGDDWTLLFTRITLHCYVKEFFRSFGQTKIWVLEIEDVVGELHHLNDNLLHELLQREKQQKQAQTTTSSEHATNPVGVLRFVDFRVAAIQVKFHCFECTTEFRCRNLSIGITDVLVKENLLYVKMQTSSVYARSYRQKYGAQHDDGIIRDGVSFDYPSLCVVADLQLMDRKLVGYKLIGVKDELVSVQLCTSFLEFVMLKKLKLIERGLFSALKAPLSPKKHKKSSQSAELAKEISHTNISVIISHEFEDERAIPLKFAVEITSLSTTKVEIQPSIPLDFADEDATTPTLSGVCHQGSFANLLATTGREFKQAILTTSTLEISMIQTHGCKGRIDCIAGRMKAFATPRSALIFQSLAECDDRIKEYVRQSELLLLDAAKEAQSTPQKRVSDPKRSSQIELDVVVKVQSWKVEAIFQAKHGLAEEMVVESENTTMTTAVSYPVPSYLKRYDFRIDKIRADVVTPFSKEKQRHLAVFLGAEFTIVKGGPHNAGAALSSVDAKFQSVSVNQPTDGDLTQISQFPVALLKEITIKRQDSRTKGSVNTEMSVSMSDSHVEWNHRMHADFLKEWFAIMAIIDKVDLMLSLPKSTSTLGVQVLPLPPMSKTLTLDARAKNTEVLIHEIRDVENAVAIQLAECTVVHQRQRLAVQTSIDCSLVRILWGSSCPAVEVVGAAFQQKALLGPQRLLAKVPVQSKIKASQMRVFMRPNLRLLQLLLRFDELINPKEESKGGQVHGKISTRQGVAFDCAQLSVEIHEKDSFATSADTQNREVHHAVVDSLEIKTVISKSFEISELMSRFVQTTRQSDAIDPAAYSQSIDQILGVEGSISATSLMLMRNEKTFANSRDLEIRFVMTDIARARTTSSESDTGRERPSKTTIFDFSGLMKCCEITLEKKSHERLARILPVIQDTFDNREVKSDDAESEFKDFDWRLRYIGNVDFGIQQCAITVPYGDNSSTIVDFSYAGLGERIMRVSVKDFALNFRQFQKFAVQFSTVRVFLEESEKSASNVHVDPPLQLMYLPQLTFNGIIHWKDKSTEKEFGQDSVVLQSAAQQFALSFELSVKSKSGVTSAVQVPTLEEALLALNWDYVYPLLVYFLTEDDDDNRAVSPSQNEAESRLQCVGLQWDVSVDVVQIAFWDILTKEVGLLLVTNDFLSHGVAKNSHRLGSKIVDSQSPWVIHEATTYVDLFRVYILRNLIRVDDYGEATVVESKALPFDSTKVLNFFFETVGTSYRKIPSPDISEDHGYQDNDVESLFSECAGIFYERLHDNFMPIDFKFSLFGSAKLRKANSIMSVAVPNSVPSPTLTPSSSTTSFASSPKSPRLWAQTVRAKLMRLKRRSSSMDNLLLNDGSCPIQVDSMKLLWTIETRDTVFYMTSLTWDSIQRLAEANKDQQERFRSRVNVSGPATPPTNGGPVKINTWRQPSKLHNGEGEGLRNNTSGPQRRGSTRDTLLDLLQQGKLGTKLASSPDEDGTQGGSDGNESKLPTGLDEGEEMNACKSIAFKKYTLDIHDAQINIREENSQSSVLAATKHIHLEVGLDGLRSHTVAHLKFDSVTAHVAPIDVDISAGVLWYAYSTASPAQSPRGSTSSCLLKQVMEECSLTMTYSQALVTGATAVEVDLSFLQLSTDRHQFYQLLNVMRHVLLAPPTIVRKPKRPQAPPVIRINAPDLLEQETSDLMVFPASPSTSVNCMSTKKTHAQVVEELRSREAKQLNSRTSVIPLKFISFRVEGTQFRLRSSPETTGADHEFVEIRAEGIAGCHTYFSNQCTKLILNLHWMEINNLRPGPSSIAFEDAMAVLKAKLLVDKRYQSSSKVNLTNQKGMLTVRAESGPLIRVLGQKLRVLDVLEVSMFPEISNIIVIQLASDFYELVYKFFFEQIGSPDHHELNSEQVLFGRKAAAAPTGQMSPSVRSTRATTVAGTPVPPSTPTQPRRKSLQISGGSMNGLLLDPNASFASNASTASASVTSSSAMLESGSSEDDDSSTDGCELFYFKYVRIGNVKLRINCNGFFVNLSDFDLDLPPYVCQSKLCTWKKLLQKFESHLKWYVTKESASSGLSHFKNKFLKWTPSASSSSDKKEKNRKDEDSSMINAQVLFGPYSGATT